MKMGADVEQKIAQLQLLEQNMQNFLAQKQNFQAHELEINNAIDELGKSKGNAYKIVGSIMINSDKNKLKTDLESKREIIALRIKNLEKQETQIKEKIDKLQEEVKEGIGKTA